MSAPATAALHPHLYTIPPTCAFTDTLAHWVMAQHGFTAHDLSQVCILVPTARAATALQEAFLRASDGKALLLPRIFPLGMDDEDVDTLLATLAPHSAATSTQIAPAVPSTQRQFLLARMILEHRPQTSAEQAIDLALALCQILDDFAREEAPIEGLRTVVRADLAHHWQVSLELLDIIITAWPKWLNDHGKQDGTSRRNAMLRMLTDALRDHPPTTPVIAAGTTGSMPATAGLLTVIARLPRGAVVLPALDTTLSDDAWDALGASHPQYAMMRLLNAMEAPRNGVITLPHPQPSPALHARVKLLQEALLPAQMTHHWAQPEATDLPTHEIPQALEGMSFLACSTQEEESLAVALAMRATLETPGKTAMFITHDRLLAIMVRAHLARYGVNVDDSAGMPLWNTPPATFLRLLLAYASTPHSPTDMLALLRHPLCALGYPPAEVRQLSRQLEREALRGNAAPQNIDALLSHLRTLIDKGKLPEAAHALVSTLGQATAPLQAYLHAHSGTPTPLTTLLNTLISCAHSVATTAHEDGQEIVWAHTTGIQLAGHLQTILEHAAHLPPIAPRYFHAILEHLCCTLISRPRYTKHPRLRILSPQEARMQSADLTILGGLNESSWPQPPQQDPWLSRAMREDLLLAEHERSIGQAAHDLYQLLCAPEVMITRSLKQDGAPAIASRWWLRLMTRIGASESATQQLAHTQQQWEHWLRHALHTQPRPPCTPPAPTPPRSARPKEYSVTQIERLMRDPYGVYAQKILGLTPLDPLDTELSVSDLGNAVHKALEEYYRAHPATPPTNALQVLLEHGQNAFAHMLHNEHVQAFWWPRFERIARAIVEEDTTRILNERQRVEVEQDHKMPLTLPALDDHKVTLKARMDRIEHYPDGKAIIIDYKTGTIPSEEDVEAGVSPQLLLERLLLQGTTALHTITLEYWKTTGSNDTPLLIREAVDTTKGKRTLPAPADVMDGLIALLEHFNHESSAYLFCPTPEIAPRYNDFTHLARHSEWS